ncbi:hypothetical protein N431DRAFT_509046 [Stipitochalara longipes BDJ]|nr:hypothetical protein N431DRAFT_509046 [Stipitochalara longipes BDJ]
MEQGQVLARVLKLATGSELSVQEILELFFAIHQNKLSIRHPVVKCANGVADATLPFFASNRVTIDPFLALVNHNCEPNATWVSNGGSVSVRALKEITANTEITFSYLGVRGDRQSRQEELQTVWGIVCHCDACKKSPPSIKGILRDHIRPLAGLDRLRYVGETNAGFSDGIFPMRELYLQVLYCYTRQKDYTKALKTALRLYYIIDKKQIPKVSPTDYLCITSVLACVVNASFEVDCKPLHNVMPLLYYHLKRQYIEGLGMWTGSGQEVFRHEKKDFLESLEKFTLGRKELEDSMEIGKSRQERRAFAVKMNKLMEWAGLPTLPEKEFT